MDKGTRVVMIKGSRKGSLGNLADKLKIADHLAVINLNDGDTITATRGEFAQYHATAQAETFTPSFSVKNRVVTNDKPDAPSLRNRKGTVIGLGAVGIRVKLDDTDEEIHFAPSHLNHMTFERSTDFLRGDRVISNEATGNITGTVIEFGSLGWRVRTDDAGRHMIFDANQLKPLPISPGSHARWNLDGHTNYIGKVKSIDEGDKLGHTIVVFENNARAPLKKLACVDNPAESIIIKAMPDGSTHQFIEASQFRVSSGKFVYFTQETCDRTVQLLEEIKHSGTVITSEISVRINEWLTNYGGMATPKPVFKRGDLVTWRLGAVRARIVGTLDEPDTFECIVMNASPERDGEMLFHRYHANDLKHVTE